MRACLRQVALQQQRGTPTTPFLGRQRDHAVEPIADALFAGGEVCSRQEMIYTEGFSPISRKGMSNLSRAGCHIYDVTERSAVLSDSLTIRRRTQSLLFSLRPRRQKIDAVLGHARLRHRSAVACFAQAGSELDPLHRRTTGRTVYAGFSPAENQSRIQQKEAELHGTHPACRATCCIRSRLRKPQTYEKAHSFVTCWRAIVAV